MQTLSKKDLCLETVNGHKFSMLSYVGLSYIWDCGKIGFELYRSVLTRVSLKSCMTNSEMIVDKARNRFRQKLTR